MIKRIITNKKNNIAIGVLLLFSVCVVVVAADDKFKCQDRRKLCMNLCCDKNQVYNFQLKQCKDLLEDDQVMWTKNLLLGRGLKTPVDLLQEFDFEERTPCKSTKNYTNFDYENLNLDYVFGNYCFTPYYASELKQYVLLPIDLNCNKTLEIENAQEISIAATKNTHLIISFVMVILTIVFALLTMFIYGSIKELRQNLQTKLFISYGVSLILPLINMMILFYELVYPFLTSKQATILDYITLYFGIASMLWSNVICYEMKRNAKVMNHTNDLRSMWIRFWWLSLFVWGLALAILLLNIYTVDRDPIYTDAFTVIFLTLNLVIFFMLTFQILRSSIEVAKLEYGTYKIMKSFRMVLRLAAMMGLSQLTYYITFTVGDNLHGVTLIKLMYIMGSVYLADAILIFALFVFKQKVLNIIKSRYLCCSVAVTDADLSSL